LYTLLGEIWESIIYYRSMYQSLLLTYCLIGDSGLWQNECEHAGYYFIKELHSDVTRENLYTGKLTIFMKLKNGQECDTTERVNREGYEA
jgi:hypothetical protein